jgi:hypothetical protein
VAILDQARQGAELLDLAERVEALEAAEEERREVGEDRRGRF